MAISFPSNIKLNAKLPLDERQVVANSAARLALKYVYSGLIVFEEDTQKLYLANKDSDGNTDWVEIGADCKIIEERLDSVEEKESKLEEWAGKLSVDGGEIK